jgi:hypothetical protein
MRFVAVAHYDDHQATKAVRMDRTRITREKLQEMFDTLVQEAPECRNAYPGKVALVAPDASGCNWTISTTSDARYPGCDEMLAKVTDVWRRTYVIRVASQFAHNGVETYLEALLLPEDGAWRYVGSWTLLTRMPGSRMGCTLESFDDPQDAIGAAGRMVRDVIDAALAEDASRAAEQGPPG